ncbi:MAG: acyl-CoA dehydrogenase family protein [Dehalococcoidia bacterium]|nr:acyl-CoA dehydrogenase family protein [Dehalococcoidia bacterium]
MDFIIPEELKQLQLLARKFVLQELLPLEELVEEKDEFPEDIRRELKAKAVRLGLWDYAAPVEYGGSGVGMVGMSLVSEEVGRVSPSVGFQSGIMSGIQGGGMIDHNTLAVATKGQIEKYLAPVIRGQQEFFIALTEPNTGSDVANIETRAVRKGDKYILNGNKMFITSADTSDFGFVIAVTDWQKRGKGGITCFIVERGTPGFTIGRKVRLMGRRGLKNFELSFDDCAVPAANVLGKEGQGLPLALAALTPLRILIGAVFTGTMERLLDMSKRYAKQRVTFGKPLAERQAVQWMLVEMAMNIQASRMMTWNAAWEADHGLDIRTKAAMIKVFVTEACFKAADQALQIHGGAGYTKDLPIERIFRDVRMYRIGEGPTEVMQMVIARDLLRD